MGCWRVMRLLAASTDRRAVLRTLAWTAALPFTACASHRWSPSGFEPVEPLKDVLRVLHTGDAANAPVVLLHELPGLTPADLALAQDLAAHGFHVYVPILFGEPAQDNWLSGYLDSCATSDFECSKLSVSSPVLERIEVVVEYAGRAGRKPVGVIGMCLTGIFPLALLRNRSVRAAVLCQPALPFSLPKMVPIGPQLTKLGLGQNDLISAARSDVPFLALRYAADRRCPVERMNTIEAIFQDRVAVICLETDNPRRHSTLAGDCDPRAFADTVRYLRVRLGLERGPQDMQVAALHGVRCQIGADGRWRTHHPMK